MKEKDKAYVFLGTECDANNEKVKYAKQMKKLREFADSRNIEIVGVASKGVMGPWPTRNMVEAAIRKMGAVDATIFLVDDVNEITTDILDVYRLAGKVHVAGGKLVSRRQGELRLDYRGGRR